MNSTINFFCALIYVLSCVLMPSLYASSCSLLCSHTCCLCTFSLKLWGHSGDREHTNRQNYSDRSSPHSIPILYTVADSQSPHVFIFSKQVIEFYLSRWHHLQSILHFFSIFRWKSGDCQNYRLCASLIWLHFCSFDYVSNTFMATLETAQWPFCFFTTQADASPVSSFL